MVFTGWSLGSLLTLGGIAGGLVVVFYVLKLRRRPVAVPFARIWARILRDKEATHLFSQLKRLLSLLLQLALLTLLLVALGDPRLSAATLEGRNIVVLVDTSASMKATDVEPTRLAAAREKVRELTAGLANADRMLIARMDAVVAPLTTMTDDIASLDAALDHLEATDTRADLERGLRFALDSLLGLSRPEIVLVGDGAYGNLEGLAGRVDLGEVPVSFVPVGQQSRNVAISQFSVRRYPLDKSRYEVMLEVTNTTDEPVDVELTLLGDGNVVDLTRLHLDGNERLPRFYADLAGADERLEAQISLANGARDMLPADDHAYALMPERRRARVLVVTEGNTYLEAALLLDEYLSVTEIAPGDYPPAEAFDVTIFDGVAPALVARTGAALYLDPPSDAGPVERGRELPTGFVFDTWDRKSEILRWMAVEDVQAEGATTLKPAPEDRVVAANALGPVLVSGRRAGTPFLALGFNPKRSDFVLRVGWPLFILNTINHFVQEDTEYISSYRTGEVWRVPAPVTAQSALLEDPSGRERTVPVKEGRAVYFGDQAGFYELTVGTNGERTETKFAANLVDYEESRIEPASVLEIAGKPAGTVAGFNPGVRRELWLYLLLAAIIVSTIEWLTYHRRLTV